VSSDEFIDVVEGSRVYMPCVYALNKIDAITMEELDVLDKIPHYVPISSHYKWNLDGLMDKVFEYLAITRVYTKPKGQMPDYSAPVILRGVQEP
jgi:ribosome-interacting GTPase 1